METISSHRVAICAVAVVALGLIAETALAWGTLGHAIVGDIAESELEPRTRRQIAELVKSDLNADGLPSGRTTLAQLSSWPDEIRGRPAGLGRESWHFIDLEICRKTDPQAACPDAQCAPAQIKRQFEILKDRTRPALERNQALKWVVHLVADIHQPLHASDRDDHGGNRVPVSFFGSAQAGETTNLHRIWDVDLLERMINAQGGEAAFVRRSISPADKARWARGTIDDWARESHDLAASVVYARLPSGNACGQTVTEPVEIDEAYYNVAAPVIARQLRKAGVRLAALLNAALGAADH